jgi:hypothetical protein
VCEEVSAAAPVEDAPVEDETLVSAVGVAVEDVISSALADAIAEGVGAVEGDQQESVEVVMMHGSVPR